MFIYVYRYLSKYDSTRKQKQWNQWISASSPHSPHLGSLAFHEGLSGMAQAKLGTMFLAMENHGKSPCLIGKPSINGPSIPWLC
jgi:hypothetical protein